MTSLAERLAELGVEAPTGGYVPLSQDELAELERRLATKLPADYVEFASTHGRCHLNAVVRTADGAHNMPLDGFFGGNRAEGVASVLDKHADYADAAPDGAFPIANNILGDLFFLWVTDPKVPGSVWYAAYYSTTWTGRVFREDGTWKVPWYRVATSFSDLLCRAEPDEHDD